jgi:hypothetical protein
MSNEKKPKKEKNGIKSKVKKIAKAASNLTVPGQTMTAAKFIAKKFKENKERGKVKKKKKTDAYRANVRERARKTAATKKG